MPQGSQSAGFSMNELMLIAFGDIPPLESGLGAEPSLLAPSSEHSRPPIKFYFDDILSGHLDQFKAFEFLRDHFLPRVDWSMLKLSFKKLRLFQSEVTALGVTHQIHGIIKTKSSRSEKIQEFPTPSSIENIRQFLGTVGICRRWIKNFTEIARPMNKLLQKDQPWEWGSQQQASFQLIKDKGCEVIEMHGIDFSLPIRLYSDASKYGGGCLITQMQPAQPSPGSSTATSTSASPKLVEHPVLFDSFAFSASQLNYGTYKKELCAIVEFARKYHYLFHAPEPSIILTDHKPLTFFIDSPLSEGIYARWASELQALHTKIEWIPGKKNSVADALSRTIFPDLQPGQSDAILDSIGHLDPSLNWVWKDGKGGYEELLKL
jgi:hypothetical protein